MKHWHSFILAGLLLASLAVLWTERGKVAALRQENERLREELAGTQRLIRGKGNALNEELERLRTEAREVHKLRSELSQLRAGAKELNQLRTENQQLRAANRQAVPKTGVTALVPPTSQEGYYAKENWSYCGYATPEAALLSVIWAMREGDTETFRASLAPEEMARTDKEWEGKTEAEISADAKRETDKISSIRILESRTLSDGEVVLSVYAAGGEDKVQKISVKRFGADWKLAGPKRD